MTVGITPSPDLVGPTGPTGAAGAAGATGPTGPTGASGSGYFDTQTFTSSTTYTFDASAKWVLIECVSAGGGGGGGGKGSTLTGPTGGRGGAYFQAVFPASLFSGSQTVTIGSGGTGGTGASTSYGSDGTSGGTSRFGFLYFYGAAGGEGLANSDRNGLRGPGYLSQFLAYAQSTSISGSQSALTTFGRNGAVGGTASTVGRGHYGLYGGGGGGNGGGSTSGVLDGSDGGLATADVSTAVTLAIGTTPVYLVNQGGGGSGGGANGNTGGNGSQGTNILGGSGGGGAGGSSANINTSPAGGNGGTYGGGGGGGGSKPGGTGNAGNGGNGAQAVIRITVFG